VCGRAAAKKIPAETPRAKEREREQKGGRGAERKERNNEGCNTTPREIYAGAVRRE